MLACVLTLGRMPGWTSACTWNSKLVKMNEPSRQLDSRLSSPKHVRRAILNVRQALAVSFSVTAVLNFLVSIFSC